MRYFYNPRIYLLCLLCILVRPTTSHAHMTLEGLARITAEPKKQTVEFLISLSIQDIGTYLKLDKDKNKRISPDELIDAKDAVIAYIAKHLKVSNDGIFCEAARGHFTKRPTSVRLFYRQEHTCKAPFRTLVIENTVLFGDKGGYKHTASILIGKAKRTTVFSRAFPTITFRIKPTTPPTTRPTPKAPKNVSSGPLISLQFLWDGGKHILEGFDHILFLLLLLFSVASLRQLFWIVTAFTLGHTITLILSAMQWISIPTQPTEAAIALSIAFVAAENIIKRDEDLTYRPVETFLFGLLHGVGISYLLREKLQLHGSEIVSPLLSFNIGVELGQLFIVAVAFPILWQLMKWKHYKRLCLSASGVIFVYASYLFIERLFLT